MQEGVPHIPPKVPEQIKALEHIPDLEEVKGIFDQLAEGKPYSVEKVLSDERGLESCTAVVSLEDGGTTEYYYGRSGPNPKGNRPETAIHYASFDKDGEISDYGSKAAALKEDGWKLV